MLLGDRLDLGEHLLAGLPLGGVARLRDPEPLALLRALDVAAQRADLALELAPDAGFGFEALVLGLQGPAGLLGGPQVPADRLLDVLDPAAAPVRRDGSRG